MNENSKLTPSQAAFLAANYHLVPVERLPDGDLLCLDRGKWGKEAWKGTPLEDEHFGPYILTTDGRAPGVTYHYQNEHGVTLERRGPCVWGYCSVCGFALTGPREQKARICIPCVEKGYPSMVEALHQIAGHARRGAMANALGSHVACEQIAAEAGDLAKALRFCQDDNARLEQENADLRAAIQDAAFNQARVKYLEGLQDLEQNNPIPKEAARTRRGERPGHKER
jgi:hypothetical protein